MFPLDGLRLSQFPPLLVCTDEDHPVLPPQLVNVATCGASEGVVKVRLEGEPLIQSATAVAVGVGVDVNVAAGVPDVQKDSRGRTMRPDCPRLPRAGRRVAARVAREIRDAGTAEQSCVL